MKELHQIRIANQCYAVVSDMFAMFLNDKMRGDKFTWDKFPDMAARICALQVALNVKNAKKDEEKYEIKAEEYGREIATHLIKTAGFVE